MRLEGKEYVVQGRRRRCISASMSDGDARSRCDRLCADRRRDAQAWASASRRRRSTWSTSAARSTVQDARAYFGVTVERAQPESQRDRRRGVRRCARRRRRSRSRRATLRRAGDAAPANATAPRRAGGADRRRRAGARGDSPHAARRSRTAARPRPVAAIRDRRHGRVQRRLRSARSQSAASLAAGNGARNARGEDTLMATLAFTKMQGRATTSSSSMRRARRSRSTPAQIRALADRRFGVGCDQVLVVEPSARPPASDFRYRIFNADGGEVEQCGNGARCFVVFVREHGLTDKREIRVETRAGVIVPRSRTTARSPWTWACRDFAPDTIPFDRRHRRARRAARRGRRTLQVSRAVDGQSACGAGRRRRRCRAGRRPRAR